MSSSNDSTTLRSRSSFIQSPTEQPLVLVVGSDRGCEPDWRGRLATFDGTLVVGRRVTRQSEGVSLVLRDPTMSSRHLTISSTSGGDFELKDLGSTNGTLVNGQVVTSSTKLKDGAIIFAGGHVMVFRRALPNQIEAILRELESPFGPVATVNPVFAVTCQRMRLLATTSEDVLLLGETGVGKEIYARAIHNASRRTGEFVTLDCASIPPELIETELFGRSRGGTWTAGSGTPGLIAKAAGGTLFIDEIGELPPRLQASLLRLSHADVRIIATTSRTAPAGESGGLRSDVAAHFGADPISIPPLRERVEDVGALSQNLLEGRGKPFELSAFQALCLHAWPGNVRELRKVLASAEALAQGSDRIGIEHLPSAMSAMPRIRSITRRRRPRPPPSAEELEALLRRHRGNVLRVSRELDRKPAVVYRWARRFGLVVKGFRPVRD